MSDRIESLPRSLQGEPAGFWTWDVKRDLVFCDPGMSHFFNLTESDAVNGRPLKEVLKAVHPGDRPAVDAAIEKALRGDPYRKRYRVRTRSESERTILAVGRCFFDSAGAPTVYPGYLLDLSSTSETDIGKISHFVDQSRSLADRLGSKVLQYMLDAAKAEIDRIRRLGSSRIN